MGEKLGYITSRDGTREKEASCLATDVAFSVAEDVDAKYDDDEVAGPAKLSEYDGGGASSRVGRVGDAIARELELIGEEDGRA
jgi:hypothetical protein